MSSDQHNRRPAAGRPGGQHPQGQGQGQGQGQRRAQGQGQRRGPHPQRQGGGGGRGGQGAGGQGGRPTPPPPPLDHLHAAYNFVPLASWVHLCPWAAQLSHDWPFADGLSGTIEFTLSNHTRLLVGGERAAGAPVRFFRMPGGERAHAIPGTSLRGMIRNVLEIATFARFRSVDDRVLGVRDLASAVKQDYQERFAGNGQDAKGQQGYKALSKSAWLHFADHRWWLEPCGHARVDYRELDAYSGLQWNTDRARGNFRPNAVKKYEYLQRAGCSLDVFFQCGAELAHKHSHNKHLIYRKVLGLRAATSGETVPAGFNRGRLVLTGHPGKIKHMDFVFAPSRAERSRWLPLPEAVMKGFLAINGESDEWTGRWREDALRGRPVPVFYLPAKDADAGPVDAIGLSQMFKLPYRLSLHQAIDNSSPQHLQAGAPDFVEAMFGYVDDTHGSLRSRLSFSVAVAEGEVREAPPVTVVLGSPKPSYYPSYIEQRESDGKLQGSYRTLMKPDARLRGWKRYPVKDRFQPAAATDEQRRVASTLHPLAPGARFRGRLRVHNLRPVEVGALLWALSWGGKGQRRHALGMGKPCGFGQVSIRLEQLTLQRMDDAPAPDAATLIEAFVCHMEAAAEAAGQRGWANSPQLRELLAMADPALARGAQLSHMELNKQYNDFARAKGGGRERGPALVLQPYSALRRSE